MTSRVRGLVSLSSSLVNLRRMAHSERKPFMIGVAGGTASGKSSVCDKLMERLGCKRTFVEGARSYRDHPGAVMQSICSAQ